MAKKKEYVLKTMTDIKIFILFLLDTIRYPVDYTTLQKIVFDNAPTLSTDYEECLGSLLDEGYVISDEDGEERYYMISETGRRLASELYDTLDPSFRERCSRSVAKHLSLSHKGIRIESSVEEEAHGRYVVHMASFDSFGEIFHLDLTVNSRIEAEEIRHHYETVPDGVYRGTLFSATGKIGFLS